MGKKQDLLYIVLSGLFILLLLLPSLQYFFRLIPEGNLYGYVEKKTTKPGSIVHGWFDKRLQRWWEETFDNNIGFKTFCVRIFNEINFRLFSEAPQIRLYSTKAHGLYSRMSIESLNYEFTNHEMLSKQYVEFAHKLIELQGLLEKNGKHFEVVISSSKAYVHPDGLGKRFLINTDSNIFSKISSLGNELKKLKVNVIDSGPLLRQLYMHELIETHPYSGVHWNYYAGCIVARDLLNDAKKLLKNTPILNCGSPVYKESTMVDVDGLLLLNVLSDVNILRPSPYPSPTIESFGGYKPKILIIGDSFMGQMVFSLMESVAYSRLVTSNYFSTREVHYQPIDSPCEKSESLSKQHIQASVINDALNSDLIVLQMVDYNVSRFGYGFVDSLLKYLKLSPRLQRNLKNQS